MDLLPVAVSVRTAGVGRRSPCVGGTFTLDGSDPQLRVRRAYVRGRFGPPKSKYGKRTIPIDHALVVELRARRKASEWPGDDDLVFPASNGEPLAA